MLSLKKRMEIVGTSIGLFCCYSVFGILQEEIFMKDTEAQFIFPVTFVCILCVFYTFLAKTIQMFSNQESQTNETSQSFYFTSAVFYVCALVTSNLALEFISYPSQVIGKALKPLPSIIFCYLIGGRIFSPRKYFVVLLVVIGAVIFLYKPNIFEKETSIAIGYSLVGFSLVMNGCEAGVEEKLRSTARPSSLNFMLYINAWSSVFLITAVAVTGEFPAFITFCMKYPAMIYKISFACIFGGLGQLFTTSMIINFGVVPCCLVLTVRKFFNVLFSVLYFGHHLELRQWLAIVLIFTSLMVDAILSFVPKKKGDENKNECSVEKDLKDSEKQDKSDSLP